MPREFKHPDIMGNKAQVERQRRLDDESLKKIKAAVKRVFEDTEDGRIVFKYILDYCDVFAMTMTGTSWTFFNEGKRDVGLHLLSLREMQWFDEVNNRRNEYLNKLEKESNLDGR